MKKIIEKQEISDLRQGIMEEFDCWKMACKGLSRIQLSTVKSGSLNGRNFFSWSNYYRGIEDSPGANNYNHRLLIRELTELGFELARFKQDSPRIKGSSIDYSKTEIQQGTIRQTYLVTSKDEDYRYDQIFCLVNA